ncbi:kinase-like domain-containing protein [Suillus ampliporus]|nr:kinase-like domain-containing protein [Suillus ampliporus]
MENDDLGVEDLPDDLTPFITRTTLDQINGGAFGDVWKCNYNADRISALVAVKAFRFSEEDGLETINRKISREIGILKILRHNNIVPLWGIATGFGRMPELRCLVSPWMPNGTLNAYLQAKHNDLSVLDRLRMLKDVSAGLRYLHSMSVAHGDITGANILIDEGGHARLIDFGLSTIFRPLPGQSHLAASSIRPGAIRYAAPELVLADDVDDVRELRQQLHLDKTDIYSVGCVMLQVLSGRLPWSEITSERLESRIPIMLFNGRTPRRPDGHPTIIDLDWDFIQKCLQSGPELRPSAHEVFDFVMHRFSFPDSSRPPDDPPDDAQDIAGASPHGGSGDTDKAEKLPDGSPLHPAHEAKPSVLKLRDQVSCHPHPRVALNNLLQGSYGPGVPDHVRWELFAQGPPHALTWTATIYIDDMNYGYGQAAMKGAAQERAATMALELLQRKFADSGVKLPRDVPGSR